MSPGKEMHGRVVQVGIAEGEALVTSQSISWCGGVDPMTGIITEPGHPIHGESVKGRVLVFLTGKGSSAFSHATHVTRVTGSNPAAIIVKEVNPQVALGVVVMHIPAITDLDQDPMEAISTGDWVRVDGVEGKVVVTKRVQRQGGAPL